MVFFKSLTYIEKQIVDRIIQGKTNKEIAYNLNISVAFVKHKLDEIFTKFNVRNRTELAFIMGKDYKRIFSHLAIVDNDKKDYD